MAYLEFVSQVEKYYKSGTLSLDENLFSYKECDVMKHIQALGKVLVDIQNNQNIGYSLKENKDLVTQYDQRTEQYINDVITNQGGVIFGEEYGRAKNKKSNDYRLLDPIDGTTNFVYGGDEWSLSLAYISNNNAIFGCIYIPQKDELYFASKGKGAYKLKGGVLKKLNSIQQRSLDQCLVSNVLQGGINKDKDLIMIESVYNNVRKITSCSSIAHDLCKIADGYYGVLICMDTYCYDFAAGFVIIQELGGVGVNSHGDQISLNAYYDNLLFAGSPEILSEFQTHINRTELQSQATEPINRNRLGSLLH